jgi:hypothetical protein
VTSSLLHRQIAEAAPFLERQRRAGRENLAGLLHSAYDRDVVDAAMVRYDIAETLVREARRTTDRALKERLLKRALWNRYQGEIALERQRNLPTTTTRPILGDFRSR